MGVVMREEWLLLSCLLQKPIFLSYVSETIKTEYLSEKDIKPLYDEILAVGVDDLHEFSDKVGKSFEEIAKIAMLEAFPDKVKVESYCYLIFNSWKQKEIHNILSQSPIDTERLEKIQKTELYVKPEVNESEEYLKNLESIYSGNDDKRNLMTGFYNIDNKIGGFRKSEAIFIGGRPASGKTTFGLNIAYNMAKNKIPVLFFSLEMGAIELHERLIKHITQISDYKNMTQDQFNRIIKTSRAIKERLPFYVYDKPDATIETIFIEAKKQLKEKNIQAVFIDHLSILKSNKYFPKRYEEVSYLSSRIKILARLLDIPVICLCQLNRNLESRDIKAPNMADIRDSGSVEQDGDIIAFVYRPEYHLLQREPDDEDSAEHLKWEEELQKVKGRAQFIIAKNRRGYTGKLKFLFNGAIFTFTEQEN